MLCSNQLNKKSEKVGFDLRYLTISVAVALLLPVDDCFVCPMLCMCLGVDPKSILCAFFKSGQCKKGDKCKFSHDINVARKSEKRNIFEEEKKGEMT